jgi:hypothetical protein
VKANYARFLWPALRVTVLLVALCAFIPALAGFLYGGKWIVGLMAFGLASFAFAAMIAISDKPPLVKGEATVRQIRLQDWWLFSYFVIIGLGFNWACVFLWFSRRYAFFSTPVIAATGLVMATYAAVALLIAWLTRGNWRAALLVFIFVPTVLAGALLRLGLLR